MVDDVELWGTFSVADHLRPHPFVTETLLYDQLVIPVPHEDHRGDDWRDRWDVGKLDRQLAILGDSAVRMPWGPEQDTSWQQRYGPRRARSAVTLAVSREVRQIQDVDPDAPAYHVTREVLADYANERVDNELFRQLKALAKRPGTRVEAVSAYSSLQDMSEGLGVQRLGPTEDQGQAIAPAAVFEWTIHAPVGDDPSELLLRAKKLAERADFREHRSFLYRHLRDVAALESETVRRDLYKRLADYENIMRRQRWHTAARRATQLLPIPSGFLVFIEPVSGALATAAVTATLGLAGYYVTEHVERPEPDERTRVAAMAYDIKAEFGDTLRFAPAGSGR